MCRAGLNIISYEIHTKFIRNSEKLRNYKCGPNSEKLQNYSHGISYEIHTKFRKTTKLKMWFKFRKMKKLKPNSTTITSATWLNTVITIIPRTHVRMKFWGAGNCRHRCQCSHVHRMLKKVNADAVEQAVMDEQIKQPNDRELWKLSKLWITTFAAITIMIGQAHKIIMQNYGL